jgi:lipoprotein-releasing system permease protein
MFKTNQLVWITFKRYLFSPRKEWLRFDSVFMFLGIVISVCTLTAAISLFDGYTLALKKAMLGANSHIYIYPDLEDHLNKSDVMTLTDFLNKQRQVKAYSTIVMKPAMLSAKDKVKGCVVHGIDWNLPNPTTEYRKFIYSGTFQLKGNSDIVIGDRIAEEMNVSIGDSVQLLRPMVQPGFGMGMVPKSETFIIVGKYRSGMYEYDNSYVFMNKQKAAAFFQMGDNSSMIEVRLQDKYQQDAEKLANTWGNVFKNKYQVLSWIYFSQSLFSLLTMEKWLIFIILTFLLLIASFNVISALLTIILEKRRDIGILKAIGSPDTLLRQIFFGRIIVIGISAVLFGELSGILLAWLVAKQSVFHLKADVYFLDKLSVQITPFNLGLIFLVSVVIIILGTLIPLKRINRMNVIEILREG